MLQQSPETSSDASVKHWTTLGRSRPMTPCCVLGSHFYSDWPLHLAAAPPWLIVAARTLTAVMFSAVLGCDTAMGAAQARSPRPDRARSQPLGPGVNPSPTVLPQGQPARRLSEEGNRGTAVISIETGMASAANSYALEKQRPGLS